MPLLAIVRAILLRRGDLESRRHSAADDLALN